MSAGPRPRPPQRSGVALLAHQARYDALAFLRNRQARVFTLALPVLFLVIFCSALGNGTVPVGGHEVKVSTYYLPSIIALGTIAASFVSLVISVTTQRETGILKRRRAAPVPAWVLIGGRALTAMGTAALITAILLAVGSIGYGARVPAGTLPALVLAVAVGAGTFCAVGYCLVTFIKSADAAQPLVQIVVLPLYFISGVFLPSNRIGSVLTDVAKMFPVYHLRAALLKPFEPDAGAGGFAWGDLGVLLIWAVVALAVAVWRFSWQPKAP
jgi:ABC-2 type transport system permease protein